MKGLSFPFAVRLRQRNTFITMAKHAISELETNADHAKAGSVRMWALEDREDCSSCCRPSSERSAGSLNTWPSMEADLHQGNLE